MKNSLLSTLAMTVAALGLSGCVIGTAAAEKARAVINDLPKIRELQTLFRDLYRANPVLVRASR
jgi:predicted PurR-regulated permease PerM